MKIPKTYHGIPIVTGTKRPKKDQKMQAQAYLNRAKKPVIKIYGNVSQWELNHELGHIKLGHIKHNRTVYDNIKYEVQAERYASKMAGKKGELPTKRLRNIAGEMIYSLPKFKKEDIRKHWDSSQGDLIKWGVDSGLKKQEIKTGLDALYRKNRKIISK